MSGLHNLQLLLVFTPVAGLCAFQPLLGAAAGGVMIGALGAGAAGPAARAAGGSGLKSRALAVAASDDNNPGVLTVEQGLRDLLRCQTLVVLEFSHDRFDEARDLEPSELRAVASIFP